MATKPLNKYAGNQNEAAKANNYDRDSGPAVHDPYAEGNPNAQGPTMRPLYDATAGAFERCTEFVPGSPMGGFPARKGQGQADAYTGADMHNDHYEAPYPRPASASGSDVATASIGGDDARPGPGGRWGGKVK